MNKLTPISLTLIFIIISLTLNGQTPSDIKITKAGKGKVNTRIDNMGYWKLQVKKGFVLAEPYIVPPPAEKGSSIISGDEIRTQDSPDVPTSPVTATTQSENSVAINPLDENEIFNSNNSTSWNGLIANNLYGANHFFSDDGGFNWGGSILSGGDINYGDPATAIGLNGKHYLGKINNNFGQSFAWSDDKGVTWHEVTVAGVPSPGLDVLDKNHLCIDNTLSSPHEGNLYDAWTTFVNDQNGKIEISRSENDGLTWFPPFEISQAANAGSHNQGVNLQTGPEGEVYAVWAIYDLNPGDEAALGFARSFNGGTVFLPATRIIDNIRGVRNTGTGKGIRVNSFPSMAVDISGGSYDGTIYVVWANIGAPGVNTGADIDVYMIRSFDKGSNWSAPIKINQDIQGLGKKHFFPWITCDPDNGNLAVIYYDDRNVTSTKCETYVSWSYDAGDSWSDLKVSDVSFTPVPISGLATSYFGDYLGISSKNRKVYPVWTDNRNGGAMSYISPLELGPAPGQSYVVYDSHTLSKISDSSVITSMSYGDSLYVDIALHNIGDEPASGVVTFLSSPSPYVSITDSTEIYGNFSVGESKSSPYGFSFDVSDTIPDDQRVRFNIRCESTDTSWMSHFILKAKAPGLNISKLTIYDTLNGNRNFRLDPGETAVLSFKIDNSGDYPCNDSWTLLQCSSENVTFEQDTILTGTIQPANSVYANYIIHVSDDALFGSWIEIDLNAYSGRYSDHNIFIETIGVVVEDWETGNFQKYPWTFGGNANWIMTGINPFEGLFSAKSSHVFENQSSVLIIDYTSGVADSISFWIKTSSEPSYDYLKFYIDNVKQGQWSGETNWTRVSYPTLSGIHNYKWEYIKDIFYEGGDDCAWVDFIEFPPPILPQINAGPDDTICSGMTFQTTGTAANYDSLRWMTYGDGIFNNDTTKDPVYTPGTDDISSKLVQLRLTAYGQHGSSSNSMMLHIGNVPLHNTINIWPNDTLCTTQMMTLWIDTIAGGQYLWSPGGFTTASIDIDTSVTGGSGTFIITATTISEYNCSSADSIFVTFKNCTGIEENYASEGISVYPNPFSKSTAITVFITEPTKLDIVIIDQKGTVIKHLGDKEFFVGKYKTEWNGTNDQGVRVAPGVYQLVNYSGGMKHSYKIILLP